MVDEQDEPAFLYAIPATELDYPYTVESFDWAPAHMPKVGTHPCFAEPVHTDNVRHKITIGAIDIRVLIQADGIRVFGGNHPLHTKEGYRSSTHFLREQAAALSVDGSFGEIFPGFSGRLFGEDASPYAVSPVLLASQDFTEPVSGEPMLYSCRNWLATHPEPHVICETAYQLKDRIFLKYSVSTAWFPYSDWQELDAIVRREVLLRAGHAISEAASK